MENNTTKTPLIYCRVSSLRQKKDGGGLESQEQRCRRHCIQKGYGEPEMVFNDSFTGGGDFMRRPAMKALLDYVISKPHKDYVVVFDDLKRFARDVVAHWELRHLFTKLGVTLESPNYEFKEDSEEGWLQETVNATFNEYDRRTNRRQVIQKQTARLQRGYWAFHAPKGYKMVMTEDGNTCFPTEMGFILKEGLEGFAYKRFVKIIDLTRFLQEKGFYGKKLHPDKYLETTKKLLLDPFYAGFIEYPKRDIKRMKGKHEAIISEEVFEANCKRINSEAKGAVVRQDIRDDLALRGLIHCSDCGAKMTAYYSRGKFGVKYPYYSCQKRGCSLRSKTIRKEIIDQDFKALIKDQKPKPELISIVAQIFDDVWKEEISGVSKNTSQMILTKSRLEEEIGKLADESIGTENPVVKKQYQKRIEEKSIQVEEIDSFLGKQIKYDTPYRTSYEKISGMIKNPYEIWEKGTVKQKQELFYFFFDDRVVYVYKEGYRTPEKSCLYRLFDQLESGHSVEVEMGVIETPSELGCECESTVRS